MSVAKVIEISAASPESFEQAVRVGLERAGRTVDGIQGAWVKDQQVRCENGRISEFRVNMLVSFILKE